MTVGPTPEQWGKMSRGQKIAYWVSVTIVFGILGSLAIKEFFF